MNGFGVDPSVVELNMAVLRTVVKLLERLKLRAPDVVGGAGSEPSDAEAALLMSGVFKRYSERLLSCLDDCIDVPVRLIFFKRRHETEAILGIPS